MQRENHGIIKTLIWRNKMKHNKKLILALTMCSALMMGSINPVWAQTAYKVTTIGDKSEDAAKITLVNKTKKKITALSVKKAEDEEFGDNLLENKKGIKNKEKVKFYYEFEQEGDYEVALTIGKTEYVLHAFPTKDVKTINILMDEEEDVAYITYISLETEEEVNTKEDEIAYKNDQAVSTDPAVSQEQVAPQQAPVQQAPAQQAPAQQAPAQQAPVQQTPAQQAPTVDITAPSDSGCLDDAILN